MRRGMKILADKFKAQEEAKGLRWSGGKNKAAYYRWFLRQMIQLRDRERALAEMRRPCTNWTCKHCGCGLKGPSGQCMGCGRTS